MPKPETCSSCGQEVRWGQPPGQAFPSWLHRDFNADHRPVFGSRVDWEAVGVGRERRWAEPVAVKGHDCWSLAEYERVKMGVDVDPDEVVEIELPEPEVWAVSIPIDDGRLPGGGKQVWNLGLKNGWDFTAFYSRAARTHKSYGKVLSIADYVVMRGLDNTDRRCVGFWVDSRFDHSWIARADFAARKYHTDKADFNRMKAWIRHEV